MSETFDRAWHERALSGDERALRALVVTHYDRLLAYCLRRARGDLDLCRDATQETFVQAVERLRSYDPSRCGGNPASWLFGLAQNALRRSRARTRAHESVERLLESGDPAVFAALARIEDDPFGAALLEREETSAVVRAALQRLRPAVREILVAKHIEGANAAVLARRLGIGESAVESRLVRARAQFRAAFASVARQRARGEGGERNAS